VPNLVSCADSAFRERVCDLLARLC
jgi:hypothetical protein